MDIITQSRKHHNIIEKRNCRKERRDAEMEGWGMGGWRGAVSRNVRSHYTVTAREMERKSQKKEGEEEKRETEQRGNAKTMRVQRKIWNGGSRTIRD